VPTTGGSGASGDSGGGRSPSRAQRGSDFDTSASSAGEVRKMCDVALRLAGFSIHSRPKAGPVLWVRAGRVFTQAEAERVIEDARCRGR
jgi:hypothetical protein